MVVIRPGQTDSSVLSIKNGHLAARVATQFVDTILTQEGIDRCIAVQKTANKLKIEVVLVSPLRRSIMAAYHIFRNHPNF